MTISTVAYRPNIARAHRALSATAQARGNAGPSYLLLGIRGEIGPGKPASAANVRADLAKAPHVQRIRLHINSPGGNLHEAFKIYAALRETGAAISAVGIGQVASAAVVVFLAADHRELKRGAVLHIHNAHLDVSKRRMTATDFRLHAEAVACADDRMMSLMVERTICPRTTLARAMRADKALGPIDALSWGLVHEVEGCPVSRPCHPAWAVHASRLLHAGAVLGLPRHMMTESYFGACRAAPRWRHKGTSR